MADWDMNGDTTIEALLAQLTTALARVAELTTSLAALRSACSKENDEICQILGKALGYPWYKDDQKNFPDATDADGVCVGGHVAITLVDEVAKEFNKLRDRVGATAPQPTKRTTPE